MEQELAGKVAIVTGAGRMRSIGRPIAKLLAKAGAALVITGTGRPPERYPDDEKAAGWRDIDSVAEGETLQEGLELDSIDFLQFVAGLAESMGREIPERDYARLSTVDGCVDYLAAPR